MQECFLDEILLESWGSGLYTSAAYTRVFMEDSMLPCLYSVPDQKFDCPLYEMFLIHNHKPCQNIQSDSIKSKLFT